MCVCYRFSCCTDVELGAPMCVCVWAQIERIRIGHNMTCIMGLVSYNRTFHMNVSAWRCHWCERLSRFEISNVYMIYSHGEWVCVCGLQGEGNLTFMEKEKKNENKHTFAFRSWNYVWWKRTMWSYRREKSGKIYLARVYCLLFIQKKMFSFSHRLRSWSLLSSWFVDNSGWCQCKCIQAHTLLCSYALLQSDYRWGCLCVWVCVV